MTTTTTTKTITALRTLFDRYGLPEQLVSDNGAQFTSEEFSEFTKANGIKHIRTAPYHPSSNGQAERFVQTFKRAMKAGERDEPTLSTRLSKFLLTYRSTPHATTNLSPSELFLKRKIRTRLDLLKPDTQRMVNTKQESQKKYHDQHAKARTFTVGQPVMIREYRSQTKWVPGIVKTQCGPLLYEIKLDDGRVAKRHADQMLPRSLSTDITSDSTTNDFDYSSTPSTSTTSEDGSTQMNEPEQRRYPTRDRREPDRLMDVRHSD